MSKISSDQLALPTAETEIALPNFDLSGKVALITGAGRGIGLAIAQTLALSGCAVAIQDIELEIAQCEAARLNQRGCRAIAIGGDLTDVSLAEKLVGETQRQLGGFHILVNNGAIQIEKLWTELSVEEIERQLRADQVMPLRLCQLASPIFRAQNWGRVLNIGSIQGLKGMTHMLAYSISKAALENMTRALAKDLAEHSITVNMLAPGYFNTWRNRAQFQSEEEVDKRGHHVPMKRVGLPSDCAGLALLLCSEAGNYITGQTIYVDGGMSAR